MTFEVKNIASEVVKNDSSEVTNLGSVLTNLASEVTNISAEVLDLASEVLFRTHGFFQPTDFLAPTIFLGSMDVL